MMSTSRIVLAILSLAVVGSGLVIRHQKRELERLGAELEHEKSKREADRRGRIQAEKLLNKRRKDENAEKGHNLKAIGYIESPFPDRRGTPRQPMLCPAARGLLRFDRSIVQEAHFAELASFSHIFVLFVFHDNTNIAKGGGAGSRGPPAKIAPPRLGGQRVGCLSTRSPHRPNPIGLSVCEIHSVGDDYIEISSLDLVDGTPVLDVKPVIPYDLVPFHGELPMALMADGKPIQQTPLSVPSWIVDADIPMRSVRIVDDAAASLRELIGEGYLRFCRDEEQASQLIEQVLRQDVRGVKQGRVGDSASVFFANLDSLRIEFTTSGEQVRVDKICLASGC